MKTKNLFEYYDKMLSDKIHSLSLPKNLEILIYLCARLFNPDFIISYFIIIFVYKFFYFNDPLFVIKPIMHTLCLLLITLVMKKITARPRPNIKKGVERIKDLRKHEKNCSMPSGDSLQCANFAIIFQFYFGLSYGFLLIPFVMFSRIFYFCHYILDTVIGASIGLVISYLIYLTLN